MPLPRALLARLHHDLAELAESPYPGVSVYIDDANVQKLCLVLTPPSGPWKDLALHFDVELPNHWPSSPPMIYSSVAGITHPNLHGNWICCDLLKEQDELEAGYSGGYTPALTLRGLFLQFLTFFSSTKVEQIDGRIVDIGDYYVFKYEFDELASLSEDQLEELWNSSAEPEVAISGIKSSNQRAIHRVKNVQVPMRRVERVNPKWHETHKLISQWKCRRCPYNSSELPVHRIPKDEEEEENDWLASTPMCFPSELPCLLEMLNDDVLLELSQHLHSESLVAFSTAYPRFQRLSTSRYVLLERELHCFFLRNPLRSSILGIGVALDPTDGRLSSDFDWLSWEAFDTYGVRTSVQKRDFEFFLPLAFNRKHFDRVHDRIWTHLDTLHTAIRKMKRAGRPRPPRLPQHPHETVQVIYKLMNNVVVLLMKVCDDVLGTPAAAATPSKLPNSPAATLLHASEKAVTAYCHLYHLLLCLSRTTPAILEDAINHLHLFIRLPHYRLKAKVPDLGELIVLMTLILALPPEKRGGLSWASLNGPVLEESTVRNVRWLLVKHPTLEVMEDGPSPYRLHTTFMAHKTGLRLMMFQIAFLDIFVKTYAVDPSRLDDNYGFPEPSIPSRMVEEVKAIYKVDTWPAFFRRVKYRNGMALDDVALSRMLRNTIQTSAQRKYHQPKPPYVVHKLWIDRMALEKQWIKGSQL